MMLETSKGKISVEIKEEGKYPNIFIKLNNVPILLIEDSCEQNKIVIKIYPNKSVYQDDEYLNLDMYEINLEEISNIRKEIEEVILNE